MRSLRLLLLGTCIALACAAPAFAQVPQTIVIDGVNDFDPSNLRDDDRNDTQMFNCGGNMVLPLDLGRIYVTNDNSFLYVGMEYQRFCFCDINVGFAIDVNGAAGGTSDPFGRRISWADVANKPDFIVYDVVPTNCNGFNFEALYQWTGTAWNNIGSTVNPGYGSGSNGLMIADADGGNFIEFRLPLSALGVTTASLIRVEAWVTQEGSTKPPLDAACSDTSQTSTPTSTVFDVANPKTMDCTIPVQLQAFVDNTPPTVASANAVGFPVLGDRTFGLVTNRIDVVFSEPVAQASAQTAGNYAVSGAASPFVISAIRDGSATNVVHLTLSSSAVDADAQFYNVTVQNVQDLAGNPIVANGTTNVGSFFVQNVEFRGDFSIGLCKGVFAPNDTFAVEGNLAPLDFTPINNALLYEGATVDSIYTTKVPFAMVKSGASAQASLEWKFYRKVVSGTTQEFEPIPGNRAVTLSSTNGANVVLAAAWNNDTPDNFTAQPVDVVFKVDASSIPGVADSMITLLGSQAPLDFNAPGPVTMLDDGVAPDDVAGDGIYAARVTFPVCTAKNVGWKVAVNDRIECSAQGDRNVFLNDALFSSANPIVLPARGIDACTMSDKAVTVVFRVDMAAADPNPIPSDDVGLGGSVAPLDFGDPDANPMLDDGLGFDAAAGDLVYTRAVTFPAGSNLSVDFKHALNGVLECVSIGNRNLQIDDVQFSTGSPQIKVLSTWNFCSEPTGVGDPLLAAGPDFAVLRQNAPNPAAGTTLFRFDLRRAGRVELAVYDLSGRRVARPLDRVLGVGPHEVAWDGRTVEGALLRSGIYVYELRLGGERIGRRMVLTR